MRKIGSLVLVTVLASFLGGDVLAAEDSGGSFRFGKKKLKGLPVNSQKKPADDMELTEDEKRIVAELAPGATHEAVKLPETALRAIQGPPRTPVLAPARPVTAPTDPNSRIIRIPQPPARTPQTPNTQGPSVSGKKK